MVAVGLAGAACVSLLVGCVAVPAPLLVWNASASAPIGLYRVYPGAPARVGEMVIASLPTDLRLFAARRHYLPLGVPLVKRVVAVTGGRICAQGARITVDGRTIAERRDRDRAGRPLPAWHGCRALARGEVFLLMASAPESFDGRYFGPTAAGDVIGRAVPLWVR
jgi:conjugative transfer signal peptidase TraF